MSNFCSLSEAKSHLSITGSTEDALIQRCLDDAEAFVLSYIGNPGPDPSRLIPRAILEQCAEFKRFRGDDPDGEGAAPPEMAGEPSPFIKRLLYRFRAPGVA